MQAPQRRPEPAVIDLLFQAPYRFDYFQALRLLELWRGRRDMPRQGQGADYLRFRNSISLAFAASQIEAIETDPPAAPGMPPGAPRGQSPRHVQITPAFMGLLGANGTLPAHYTERIAQHTQHYKDEGPLAFLDTFSSRSLALFYEAWRKYRLVLKAEPEGEDAFLPLLLALAGLGYRRWRTKGTRSGRDAVLDQSVGYFAASIRQRPASAVQVSRVLTEYFGQSVAVEQFVGCWYEVPEAQRTVVGSVNCVLGGGAMAGRRSWQRDLRLRLLIGPLDRAGFEAFLPGGTAARALRSLLAMFTGVSLDYEVRLLLRAADVRGLSLDRESRSARLGWDSYLVKGAQARDRSDVRYDILAS